MLVIQTANYPDWIGRAGKFVENSTKLALKLPVIRSRTVQCYGFYNFKSGMDEGYRMQIVTAEGVAKLDKNSQRPHQW